MTLKKAIRVFLFFFLSFQLHYVYSQNCSPDIFAISYQGNAACFVQSSLNTPQNDIISAGQVLQINGGLGYDGWISKFSGRGTFLWAKRYMLPGYNSGAFSSISVATDSTYFVSGRFAFLKKRYIDGVIEELYGAAFLLHLDKYGNLLWAKTLNTFVTYFTFINRVFKMTNGDYILNIGIFSINYSRTLICRMDINGNVKWSSIFFSDEYRLSVSTIKQTRDGNLVLGGTYYDNNFSNPGYFLMGVYPQSGGTIFSKAITIKNTVNSFSPSPGAIQHISEYSNGELGIHTSLSDTGRLMNAPYTLKAATLITDDYGNFIKAVGYYNNQPGCRMVDAGDPDANGNQFLLMDDGIKGLLIKTDRNGQVLLQKAYGGVHDLLAPVKLLPANRILYGGRGEVALMGLVKTESNGDISCMETPVNMVAENVSTAFISQNLPLNVQAFQNNIFDVAGGGVGMVNYILQATVDCEVTCCTNSITTSSKIELCDVPSYTLPNNYIVKESGVYDIAFQSSQGCDSIVFYDIALLKKPRISLGDDECLEGKDSVMLKVAGGYQTYQWMNIASPDSNYRVDRPGQYWVEVTNVCGSTIDSIEVFDRCDFPVYIPSGFTPNGDGLNDIFRVPWQNKNKLVSLKLFNRWGQLIFETRNVNIGWDGKYKNLPQPEGMYVYVLEMKNLAGRKVTSRGTITLVR